uniref:Uncharacterized protein n=1 Tax=Glossina austeni TaxID=7395 RepID=A0A1A9UYV8_GLOAU
MCEIHQSSSTEQTLSPHHSHTLKNSTQSDISVSKYQQHQQRQQQSRHKSDSKPLRTSMTICTGDVADADADAAAAAAADDDDGNDDDDDAANGDVDVVVDAKMIV